jgi:hypothetical protein
MLTNASYRVHVAAGPRLILEVMTIPYLKVIKKVRLKVVGTRITCPK